jgi:hypothetical protein
VVLSAGGSASVVASAAVGHALVAPLLAGEVWQGLGVLCHVGRKTVAAHARESQGRLIACVFVDVCGFGGGLQADQL